MNPFEALGEAMQTVGLWVLTLWCRVFGHRWEASTYPEPYNYHVEAWFCRHCWEVEYPKRSADITGGDDAR